MTTITVPRTLLPEAQRHLADRARRAAAPFDVSAAEE